MFDLLFGTDGKVDVNAIYRPLNRKWYLIDFLFMTMARCGDHSAFVMDIAHTKGSTPLHGAAMYGQSHLVEWLLARGAKKSLGVKNNMGATPLDVARIFGPHPEVESLLSAAMLEANFKSKYKVRRGTRILIVGADESGGDEAGDEEDAGMAVAPTPPAVAEGAAAEEDKGAEAGEDAANGQNIEEESLVVEPLEDGSVDQRPTHTGVSCKESGVLERGGDGDGGGGGGGGVASSDLAKQLGALQREQDKMHGKLGVVDRKLGAVDGKLDAVLAWIATEKETREGGGR